MSPWLRMSPLRIQIQIAFLGETKRTIPRSRPASGRVSRAGLVQDAACGTGAQRRLRPGRDRARRYACLGLDSMSRISARLGHQHRRKQRRQITCFRRYRAIEMNSSSVTVRQRGVGLQCRPIGQQRSCCDDQLNPPNTPRSSSAIAVVRPVCDPRWVRSAMPMTTRCARASSRPSNANCSIAAGSRRRPRREPRCSPSSRASTIRDAATHRSDTSHRLTTNTGIMQQPSIATHTSLPPCSRPSRTSPSGGRRKRPSLTATARGSRVSARVGTEVCLRRGPNQRMPGTGGYHDVKPESLIPNSHLSTKPG